MQEQLRHVDVQTTTGYTRLTQQDVRQALETLDDEGSEKRIHVPPPRGMKFRGEYHHEITVVAPTGFEPVFWSRSRFRQQHHVRSAGDPAEKRGY